jgi:hypothetical protein
MRTVIPGVSPCHMQAGVHCRGAECICRRLPPLAVPLELTPWHCACRGVQQQRLQVQRAWHHLQGQHHSGRGPGRRLHLCQHLCRRPSTLRMAAPPTPAHPPSPSPAPSRCAICFAAAASLLQPCHHPRCSPACLLIPKNRCCNRGSACVLVTQSAPSNLMVCCITVTP